MKKFILITTFSLALFTNTYGQVKKIQFDDTPVGKVDLSTLKITKKSIDKKVDFVPNYLNLSDAIAAAKGVKILARDEQGLPLAIEGAIISRDGERNKTIEEKSFDHLKSLSSILKLKQANEEFKIISVNNDELKQSHVKMQQVWNDIPVFGKEMMVHAQDGSVNYVNGRYALKPAILETAPSLDDADITDRVGSDLNGLIDVTKVDAKLLPKDANTKTLVYYPMENGEYKLAYHFIAYKNLISRWDYFVDAKDGTILNKYTAMCMFHNHKAGKSCGHNHENVAVDYTIDNKIKVDNSVDNNEMMDGPAVATATDLLNVNRSLNTYQVGSKFYLIDGARPMFKTTSVMPNDPEGAIWTINAFNTAPQKDNFNYDHVTSTNNLWASKVSVSAHYNGGKAYEYFKDLHTRNSINGTGGTIISFINVADEDGSSMGNAFWNGAAMFYGNGDASFFELARGLDVAAHEMSHGVIQNTANLVYQGESGALNESYADVFGVLVDRADWQVGEDVVKTSAFPSGALRSVSDPHNGAATGDFGKGWQPRVYSERYTGSQDNGGVHLNSGIPNYAFFLFANNSAVGKDRAEKVYYRALTNYLTKSSKFVDQRLAVIKAATDLFGAGPIVNAAASAFDQVGIGGSAPTNTQTDVNTNPGNEFVIFTTADQDNVFLYRADGTPVVNPMSEKNPISRFTVTDDGSAILFVADDNNIHTIDINWATNKYEESATTGNAFRNVAISKDGSKLAILRKARENKIFVYDFASEKGQDFVLTNPTSADGVSTGDVLYADAIEWDFNGEFIMYDAENSIRSTTAGEINYWDISFIKVWDNKAKGFTKAPYLVDKLFPSLDEGLSIGNPTFSKNSPYIIAFDYIDENAAEADKYRVLGANIETGKVGIINKNNAIGYPSYAKSDRRVIYEGEGTTTDNLYYSDLAADKITGVANSEKGFKGDANLGVYFSNGARVISSLDPVEKADNTLSVAPNPVQNETTLSIQAISTGSLKYEITDAVGKMHNHGVYQLQNGVNKFSIQTNKYPAGLYFIKVTDENNKSASISFVKM